MLEPICGEQQIGDSIIQLIEEIYIPKQRSFTCLTNSYIIIFDQSFIRALGRFDMIIGFRYVLTFQSVSLQ